MKPLNAVLMYDKGHICKMNPTEVEVFYLQSSKQYASHLRVRLEIEMRIAKTVKRRFVRLPSRASVIKDNS